MNKSFECSHTTDKYLGFYSPPKARQTKNQVNEWEDVTKKNVEETKSAQKNTLRYNKTKCVR